jgi:hypothetical protein
MSPELLFNILKGNGGQLNKPAGKSKAHAESFTNTLQGESGLSAGAAGRKMRRA